MGRMAWMAALGGSCQGERALYETEAARLGLRTSLDHKHGRIRRLPETVGTALSPGWAMHKEHVQWWALVMYLSDDTDQP